MPQRYARLLGFKFRSLHSNFIRLEIASFSLIGSPPCATYPPFNHTIPHFRLWDNSRKKS